MAVASLRAKVLLATQAMLSARYEAGARNYSFEHNAGKCYFRFGEQA